MAPRPDAAHGAGGLYLGPHLGQIASSCTHVTAASPHPPGSGSTQPRWFWQHVSSRVPCQAAGICTHATAASLSPLLPGTAWAQLPGSRELHQGLASPNCICAAAVSPLPSCTALVQLSASGQLCWSQEASSCSHTEARGRGGERGSRGKQQQCRHCFQLPGTSPLAGSCAWATAGGLGEAAMLVQLPTAWLQSGHGGSH